MIDTLREAGFRDEAVLAALQQVPRHFFLDKAFEEWAYQNIAFPIGSGQTISQPLTVAIQTSLLEIRTGQKVLEVGTGSGYQASVLATLGAKVYTIERQSAIFTRTDALLRDIGFGMVRTFLGDGYAGLPRFAPFDHILVTAGATELPEELARQLAVGGHLVIPIGDEATQVMWRYTRQADGTLPAEEFGRFKFVPFLKGVE